VERGRARGANFRRVLFASRDRLRGVCSYEAETALAEVQRILQDEGILAAGAPGYPATFRQAKCFASSTDIKLG
jgi:hypothetical protein